MRPRTVLRESVLVLLSLLTCNCAAQRLNPVRTGPLRPIHDLRPALIPGLSKLRSMLPQAGEEVSLPVSELTGLKNIKIKTPKLDLLLSTDNFDTRATAALNESLPKALTDFGKDPSLSDRGVPLIKAAIVGIFSGDPALAKRDLEERGIFGDLWSFVKDVGCTVFAAAAVPAYLIAAGDFALANGNGKPMNDDLLYHMWPIHGDFALTAPVTVYYRATRPPFFGSSDGTVINRDVYIVDSEPPTSFTPEDYRDAKAVAWQRLVRLLIHEVEHVKQYRDTNYFLPGYAHKYLFEFCKAGSYRGNVFEAAAYAQDQRMDGDISDANTLEFWFVWRATPFSLKQHLGFPTETGYTRPDGPHSEIREKSFERGVLQLKNIQADGTHCFRTYTHAEVAVRYATFCPPPKPCTVKVVDYDDEVDPSVWPRPPRPFHMEPCTGEKLEQWEREQAEGAEERERSCRQRDARWRELNGRVWRCGFDVPGF